MNVRKSGILKAVAKDAGLNQGHALQRQAFRDALAAGLAAPTMFFNDPPKYAIYDASTGVSKAWGSVGRHMISALKADSQ